MFFKQNTAYEMRISGGSLNVSTSDLRAPQSLRVKVPAPAPLHVEAEVEDVAVLYQVLRAFDPHLAGFLGAGFAVAGDEVGARDGLGADEAALEVGVDLTGRFRGLGAAAHGPGACPLGAVGEEGRQVEQVGAGAGKLRQKSAK